MSISKLPTLFAECILVTVFTEVEINEGQQRVETEGIHFRQAGNICSSAEQLFAYLVTDHKLHEEQYEY